jgi:hypothetical protein
MRSNLHFWKDSLDVYEYQTAAFGEKISFQMKRYLFSLHKMSMNSGSGSIVDKSTLKGSVQRKLRWVKNGVNRSVGASDCGAGHSFVVFRFHLGFTIFPFPVSTAKFIGIFWKNKRSATSDVAPIVLALYRIRYWRYVDSCA